MISERTIFIFLTSFLLACWNANAEPSSALAALVARHGTSSPETASPDDSAKQEQKAADDLFNSWADMTFAEKSSGNREFQEMMVAQVQGFPQNIRVDHNPAILLRPQ